MRDLLEAVDRAVRDIPARTPWEAEAEAERVADAIERALLLLEAEALVAAREAAAESDGGR